jgi:Ca2+-binding RTX toxin-like protein
MARLGTTAVRAAVATVVVGATIVVAAAPAYAADSDLDVVGTTIHYTADAGVTNDLTITRAGDTDLFVDVGGDPIVSADPACSYPVVGDTTRMQCVVAGLTTVSVSLGDLDDIVRHRTDRVAYLYGGSGADTLHLGGRAGVASFAYGNSGNDTIASGPGDDVISGSTGTDTVTYAGTSPVTASLVTNTATRSGDTDSLSGIENLTGGTGSDTLVGSNAVNVLDGGSALLCGGIPVVCSQASGHDTMFGLGGADTVYGRSGNDWIWGGDADDLLYGEAGHDHLFGDAWVIYNSLFGGSGTDECVDGEQLDCEN